MKLIILLIITTIGSCNKIYAQFNKQWAVSGSFNMNFENNTTYDIISKQTEKTKNYYFETNFSLGYFIKKNWLVGFNGGGYYYENGTFYLNEKSYGLLFGLNSKYYFKINDQFYFSPEINPYIGFGKFYDNIFDKYYDTPLNNKMHLKLGSSLTYLVKKNTGFSFGLSYSTQVPNKIIYNFTTIFLLSKKH